jgi:signal peptidase I
MLEWQRRATFRREPFYITMQPDGDRQARPGWLQILLVGHRPKVTLLRALVLAAICIVVFHFILVPIRVQGISMLPTYRNGQRSCLYRLAYLWQEPRRGDIVSVRFAKPGGLSGPSVMLMKRVIGLPGETVSFREGHASINGKQLDEPYVKLPCDWHKEPITCSSTQYYVVGDNRSMPFELHEQGRAERNRIVGKLIL